MDKQNTILENITAIVLYLGGLKHFQTSFVIQLI